MLSKLKTYLTLISMAVTIISVIYGVIMRGTADRANADRNNMESELLTRTAEVTTYLDANGFLVTQVRTYEKSISNLQVSKDSIERLMYKAVKESNIKSKNIQDITALLVNSHGTVPLYRTDTIKDTLPCPQYIRTYKDGFLNATVYPDSILYEYNGVYTIIGARETTSRKFFLWRWMKWDKYTGNLIFELKSANPKDQLTGRRIITPHKSRETLLISK